MPPRFKVNIVHRPLGNGNDLFYYQVLTPSGEVALDQIAAVEMAERFCSYLNLALGDYIPVIEAARNLLKVVNIDKESPAARAYFIAMINALKVIE